MKAAAEQARDRRGLVVGLAIATMLALAPGCGDLKRTNSGSEPQIIERSPERDSTERAGEVVAPSHCAAWRHACRTTEGRIVYVERVDPDGDGDVHFVVLDPQGITLPGLTSIDVGRSLRPHPLPGAGELISAAGPVQTGSLGQSQIHALELHVARH